MNFSPECMQRNLEAHRQLCQELLELALEENQRLRSAEPLMSATNDLRRRELLPRLDRSLVPLVKHRLAWQKLPPQERARFPEIGNLIRTTQEAAMKIIVLDRENEQLLVRRGMLPARTISNVAASQPHRLAGVYQQHRHNLP